MLKPERGYSGKGVCVSEMKVDADEAVNLALSIDNAMLIDCDVEGPNSHIFFKEPMQKLKDVSIPAPEFDPEKCSLCGQCATFCRYNAIAVIADMLLFFEELCHGCGSCTLNCPEQAISETLDVMGVLEAGPTPSGIYLARGVMNVGEPMAVPIIRQLKKWEMVGDGYQPGHDASASGWETIILDVPPGTSCPVVESVYGADFVLLVTEPTPFGLHDLRLMVDVVCQLHIPAGVIINRDGIGNADVDQFCAGTDLPVLMRIPLDREIGQGIAQGKPLVAIRPEYTDCFRDLYRRIQDIVREADL